MLRVLSLFSGIGAFEVALDEEQIEWELDHYCEIDKYACQAYNCIHDTTDVDNLKDVTNIDYSKVGPIDLVTYGFPCQDISVAGKGAGFFDEDGNITRSGLFFNAADIIRHTNPKFAIFENVKNLTGKRFKAEFETVLNTLDELGYNTYWKVLNAKDYGIPQNRERVFGISIRKDIDHGYEFPLPVELTLRLKDMLEEKVDEKYYLSQDKVDKFVKKFDKTPYALLGGEQAHQSVKKDGISTTLTSSMGCGGGYVPMINEPSIKELGFIKKSEKGTQHQSNTVYHPNGLARTLTAVDYKSPLQILESKRIGGLFDDEKGKHQAGSIWDTNHLAPTLDTMQGGYRQPCVIVPEATKKGYAEAVPGDSINLEQPNSKTRRGRVGKGIAQTLTTSPQQAVVEPKMTYLEKSLKETIEKNNGELGEGLDLYNRRVINDGIAKTLGADCGHNGTAGNMMVYRDFRIRKLTPRECWRLMGFKDKYFDRVQGVSNTQLYKQAGNSIVVDVLRAIFRELKKQYPEHFEDLWGEEL